MRFPLELWKLYYFLNEHPFVVEKNEHNESIDACKQWQPL